MPFTTRPSFTSRHGMIRLASIRQCLLEFDAALVKRLTDDDAVQPLVVELGKLAYIRKRRHTARSNNREAGVFEHLLRTFDVWSLQNAVARNIRVNHETSADLIESPGKGDRRDVGIFGPTGYLNISIKRIDADGDIVRALPQSLSDEGEILYGGGSENDAVNPRVQQAVDYRHIPDSAADLYFCQRHRRRHFTQQVEIFQFAPKCAIKIDDVQ